MSQKRPSKRSRSSYGEAQGQYSPGNEYLKPKRSKFEEHAESTDESSVRRSSRAPKPKLFDDGEYFDTHSSSFEDNESRGKKDRTLSPTKQPNNPMLFTSQSTQLSQVNTDSSADSCRRKSSRPPKPKVFDEDFIDSPKNKVESKTSGKEIETQIELNVQKHQKSSSHKRKGERKEIRTGKSSQKERPSLIYTKDKQITPKVRDNTKPSASKMLSYYGDVSLQESSSYSIEGEQGLASNKDESSKVRHSSRTPKPKKTFALIEDSSFVEGSRENSDDEVPSNELISSKSHSSKSTKSQRHSHTADFHGQFDTGRFDYTEDISTTMDYMRQNEASKIDNSDKKSKKKSSKSAKPVKLEHSQDLIVDVVGLEMKEKEDKKDGKEKNKKSSTKSKDIHVAKDNGKKKLKIEESSGLKVDKTKPKHKPKKVEKPEHPGGEIEIPQEKSSSKLPSNENSKKTHLKHTKSKPNKPLCETKDEDKHIILKLHLSPHTESSSHSHSHKKHKHKHHSTDNRSEKSPSDGKVKKRKLSMDNSSSNETRKKVSIKFKGLSSSELDVEVGEESPFSLPSSGKVAKEPEVKKKKSKKHSHGEALAIPSTEQEHVKVIIKKSKKEIRYVENENEEKLADKTQTKDPKAKPKVPKVVSKESELKKPKSSPKKKSKGGSTPSKNPNEKEKKKVITGYLMFCKSKRSQIAEANPGLEFPQISQKVGEAWNNLTDEEKQKWKDKANSMKAKLNINTVEKKPEKKADVVKVGPDVVDMAAHLKLLGESLSLIGASLMAQRGTEVHGSLSVLLDSILCAICPLTFLTSHIPGIPGVSKENQVRILDDLAYTMPGLG